MAWWLSISLSKHATMPFLLAAPDAKPSLADLPFAAPLPGGGLWRCCAHRSISTASASLPSTGVTAPHTMAYGITARAARCTKRIHRAPPKF